MATFTLVTNRRSSRPNRGYSRPHVRPQQTMPSTREEFRRQFPTHHDAENHYAGSAAAAPQGSWGQKLRLNTTAPQDFAVRYKRAQKGTQRRVAPTPQVNHRPCAYCKEFGHHIRHCQKAAAATAKKQEWKRQEKARRAEEKFNLAEERLRKQILAAQEAKLLEQQPVVEEESDSSDSDYEEEEASVTVNNDEKIAEIVAKIAELRKSAKGASWADAADIDDEIDELEEELEKLGHTA
jgi:hypothetical protein